MDTKHGWALRSARTGLPETAAVAAVRAATKAEWRAKEEAQTAQREAEDNNLREYHRGYDRWRPLDARIKELYWYSVSVPNKCTFYIDRSDAIYMVSRWLFCSK